MTTSTTATVDRSKTIINAEKLSKNNHVGSLWVAVYGKVYDLTDFASDHPGGVDVLKDTAGTDATESFEYAGHTDDAITAMREFQVGSLEGIEDSETKATLSQAQPTQSQTVSSGPITAKGRDLRSWARTLGFAVALATGFALQSLVKESHNLVDGVRRIDALLRSGAAGHVDSSSAFVSGSLFASAIAVSIFGYLYGRFHKTLQHEKSVFLYPAVIPRGATKL